jgi:hypothetical protein
VLLLLISALVLLLGACGGDDESATEAGPTVETAVEADGGVSTDAEQTGSGADSAPSDEERIEGTIAALLTSSDPAEACDEAVTDAFLRRAYGDRAGCGAALAPAALARRVRIRMLEIAGAGATAVVLPEGGVYDGQQLDVMLVREGDRWEVDGLEADIPVGP